MFEWPDLITIVLLVLLEGLLSADNALVLAVLVLSLPKHQQKQALRYGILGAFFFRAVATLLAVYLIELSWVKLAGAAYLLYLPYAHFYGGEEGHDRRAPKPARPMLGMSAFWTTVVKVELTDIVFAIDSILVAVIAMRLVIGKLLTLIQKYPALVDGAFVIIAWVGIKLLLEFAHQQGYVHFEVPKWLALGLIVVIFAIAFFYARKHPHVEVEEEAAAHKVDQLEKDLL
jgi:predicted tellurium resistance membrane protein TerC